MLVALTREVGPALDRCELTHLRRVTIDPVLAARQHEDYERALAGLGCAVRRLPTGADMPDGVFIEDTAVVLDELAVAARPGAPSRRAETDAVAEALRAYRPVARVEAPGTLDGGDVLRAGRTIFVGLSSRTNREGLEQVRRLAEPLGYAVEAVEVTGCLHLKTAVTLLDDHTVLINPAWLPSGAFAGFTRVAVDPAEPFAANVLRIGEARLHGAEFPRTRARLAGQGFEVHAIDMSELAKAEGGVTCCSLVFPA